MGMSSRAGIAGVEHKLVKDQWSCLERGEEIIQTCGQANGSCVHVKQAGIAGVEHRLVNDQWA